MAPRAMGVNWAFPRPVSPLGSTFTNHVLNMDGEALSKPQKSLWGWGGATVHNLSGL